MILRTAFGLLLAALCASAQSRQGFLNVPGGPVWFQVLGSGSKTPILTVHGGPGGTSCHFTELAPLAQGRALVLFDQLGSGRSGRPQDAKLWQLDRFVEELDIVRKRLGLRRVHLFGHSWGGALVAQYVLAKGGAGIESLILGSPLLSTADWIRDAENLRKELPAEVQTVLRKHEAAGTTNSPEYRAAEAEFNRRFLRRNPNPRVNPDCAGSAFNAVIYEQMWGPSEFHATGSLRSFDVTPSLAKLRMPVLLMVGEHDEARPETAARYQRQMPNAELQVIPGAAHATWADNRDAVLQVLKSFLEKVERRRSAAP